MSALRELFTSARFEEVRTDMESGDVVLSSDASPTRLARANASWTWLAGQGLCVAVTMRNRSTATTLLAMADE